MVIHNGIRIEGAFKLETLLELKIDIMPNAHAGAMIKGIFNGVKELERWQMTLERHEVGIYSSLEICHASGEQAQYSGIS